MPGMDVRVSEADVRGFCAQHTALGRGSFVMRRTVMKPGRERGRRDSRGGAGLLSVGPRLPADRKKAETKRTCCWSSWTANPRFGPADNHDDDRRSRPHCRKIGCPRSSRAGGPQLVSDVPGLQNANTVL